MEPPVEWKETPYESDAKDKEHLDGEWFVFVGTLFAWG